MSAQVYADGVLVQEWDDTTRTHTDYRTDPPTTRPYTQAENDAADQRAADAATIADHEARITALEAWRASLEHVDPETDPTDVPDWPSESDYLHAADAILPGALVRFPAGDGLVYRNIYSLPLAHSPALIPPETYPHLWQHVPTSHDPDPEPEPIEYPEWQAGADYAVGDLVTYDGRLYECILAHDNAPPNWQPPVAHGQWTDLGPWPPD